jgi:hypothetical protein
VHTAASEALRAAGLTLAIDASNVLCAVAPLPLAPDAARKARLDVLRLALELQRRFDERADPSPRVHTIVVVHAGTMITRREPGQPPRPVAGDLLSTSEWAAKRREDAVVATDAALAGVEDCVQTSALEGGGRRLVRVGAAL